MIINCLLTFLQHPTLTVGTDDTLAAGTRPHISTQPATDYHVDLSCDVTSASEMRWQQQPLQ